MSSLIFNIVISVANIPSDQLVEWPFKDDISIYITSELLGLCKQYFILCTLCWFFFSALFFGGLVNFAFLFFIIISANSDLSHIGKQKSREIFVFSFTLLPVRFYIVIVVHQVYFTLGNVL